MAAVQPRRISWALLGLLAISGFLPAQGTVLQAPQGYTYLGQGDTATLQRVGVGRTARAIEVARNPGLRWDATAQAAVQAAAPQGPDGPLPEQLQHHTVMFSAEGHTYVKPLAHTNGAAAALAGSQVQGDAQAGSAARRMLRAGDAPRRQLQQSSNFDPDLKCDGCPSQDTRAQVSDSRQAPFAAVGLLTREQRSAISGTVSQCTGTLIGTRHVLTAGHCVVNTDSWQAITSMEFEPAVNGNSSPFPTIKVSRTRVLDRFVSQQNTSLNSLNYDFALVTLASDAPVAAGQLPLAAGNGQAVYTLTTAGYPGDKPDMTMWTVGCPNVRFNFDSGDVTNCGSLCSNMVQHDCLTSAGQSGSAMWDSSRTIRAIVTGALTLSDGSILNVGTEMNSFVYNTLAEWYNEDINGTATSGNVTGETILPLAPPGPSSQVAAAATDAGHWLRDHLNIVIPVAVGVGVLLALLLLLCCCCGRRSSGQAKPVVRPAGQGRPHPAMYPQGAAYRPGPSAPIYYNQRY